MLLRVSLDIKELQLKQVRSGEVGSILMSLGCRQVKWPHNNLMIISYSVKAKKVSTVCLFIHFHSVKLNFL